MMVRISQFSAMAITRLTRDTRPRLLPQAHAHYLHHVRHRRRLHPLPVAAVRGRTLPVPSQRVH